MKREKKDEYVLQVKDGGRWKVRERLGYPKPLIEAAGGIRRNGGEARVMHGDVQVGSAGLGVF